MIKRILVGIGGTAFTAVAIDRAVELAAAHNARITAVSAVDPDRICKMGPVPAGAGAYAKKMCENRLEVTGGQLRESVDALEQSCSAAGVPFTVEWETENAFDLLISHARYHDLTVFGLRSIFDYQLVEEPEKDLIRVLSQGVRPILAVSKRFRPIHKVMVAYSGSMESAKAMRRFVQFKLWPDAELTIVHFSDGHSNGKALLKDAADYCKDYGFKVQERMITGKPSLQLLASAEEMDADMIVMGNSIRSIWLRKILGDTVLDTLTRADRPLFLSQ